MKLKFITSTIASLALSLAVSGSAHAALIAGWDFSQFAGDGVLSVDGTTFTNVLSANYSNLFPAPGAGPSAAPHGTLFFDGQFGSTDVAPDSPTAQVGVVFPSLTSNINAPVTSPGFASFDALTTLAAAGQPFQNALAFQIQSPVSFVFAAYLASVPGLGEDWSLSFAGQTLTGTSVVAVDYSTNGATYLSAGQRTITSLDSLFTVDLAGIVPTDAAFIRFTVDTAGGVGTRIDNVALNATVVPEPATAVLLGAALAAFAVISRRRAT